MRSEYLTLLFLAAAAPLLADEESDCRAQASATNGVILWKGEVVHFDKGNSSSGITTGCTQLGLFDGQILIGDKPSNNDTRSIIETNPAAKYYDVSYILGYSHSVACKDMDSSQKPFTGDSMDLWNTGAICHQQNGKTCVNPVGPSGKYNSEMSKDANSCRNCSAPDPFFAPVAGAAYTFPMDNGAVFSVSSNAMVCCVGPDCKWKNPKAGTTKNGMCSCGPGTDKRDAAPETKPKRHPHGHGTHRVKDLSEFF